MDREALAQRYARLRRAGKLVGLGAALLGACVLGMWMLDMPSVRSLMRMRPNTALSFVLLGTSMGVLGAEPEPRLASRWIAGLFGTFVAALTTITLCEWVQRGRLGLDTLLARPDAMADFGHRMRMPPMLALTLALIACSTVLTARGRSLMLAQALAALASVPPIFAILGHVYRVETLYALGPRLPISLLSAFELVALAGSVLLIRPDQGLAARMTENSPAAVMVRRLLPAVVLLPMALGGVAYAAEQAGWIDAGVQAAVVTIGIVAGLVLLVSTSSSALERLERERGRVEDDLRRAVRARDDFLSVASHELRTPTTTLLLHVDGLLRSARTASVPRAQLVERLESVRRQATRLERLVDALLDVSRATRGHLELAPEPMDISEAIAQVVDRFAMEARRAGSEIVLHVPEHVEGRWDPQRIDQVVSNLLSNAVKYGKGAPVEVDLEAEPDRVRLKVTDGGIGVAPEDRDRIFQRFERAVSDQNYPGLGLGLWIARQLVASMGGVISVDGAPGRGATFTVELPRPA